ncbi:MAG: hypothetical protein IT379_24150 [Deltaproteobacteria bacterium]|nr:hypothetical protein [Deltaproteobacteria bacterium]
MSITSPSAARDGAPSAAALSLVAETLNGLRVVTLAKAVGVLILAVVGIALFLGDPDQTTISGIGPTGNLAVAVVALGGAVGIAGYLLVQWHGARPARDLLYATLRDTPARVVWIYEVQVEHARTRTHMSTDFYFGMVDGSLLEITIPRVHTEAVRKGLLELCPSAVRGYSDELARSFRANPALLPHAAGV